MKIILIICVLIGVHSTMDQVRELRETPNGLVWRRPVSATTFESYVIDLQNSFILPNMISFSEPLRLLPIGLGSNYACRTNSTMILPPSELYPYFRMITNPVDPTTYCFEGTIGFADLNTESHVGLDASVEVIPPPRGDSSSSPALLEEASTPYPYELSTVANFDVIPRWAYDVILAQIMRFGVDTADDEDINLLPSIQYTIYRSRESDDIVARIVSEPRDYLDFTPEGMRLMVQPNSYGNRLKLGINTLKHIGVLLDYQRHQIGFCEPL